MALFEAMSAKYIPFPIQVQRILNINLNQEFYTPESVQSNGIVCAELTEHGPICDSIGSDEKPFLDYVSEILSS